jgi:hypothetical protein
LGYACGGGGSGASSANWLATGSEATPQVRLSPNARYSVNRSSGGGRTVTVNSQVAVRVPASRAWQVTRVEPISNGEPDGGEHVVVTGCAPPVETGGG